jgi:hypothetical protein
MAEQQRCAIEFCIRLGKNGSEILQLIHQAYGVHISPHVISGLLKKGVPRQENHLFRYPPEACGKRSAARFREVGGAL